MTTTPDPANAQGEIDRVLLGSVTITEHDAVAFDEIVIVKNECFGQVIYRVCGINREPATTPDPTATPPIDPMVEELLRHACGNVRAAYLVGIDIKAQRIAHQLTHRLSAPTLSQIEAAIGILESIRNLYQSQSKEEPND